MYFGIDDKNVSLFLERLVDGPDNELTLYVANSTTSVPNKELIQETNPQLREILSECSQVIPDYSQLYKIHFENYIVYQVGNESYASAGYPEEIRAGHGLILFQSSRLLNSLSIFSDAFDNGADAYPAKYRHYGVHTHSHVINIISHIEPKIVKVSLRDVSI